VCNTSQQAIIDFSTVLGEGTFKRVYSATYSEGTQKGDPAVWKVLKKGAVFDTIAFGEDVQTISKAKEIVTAFNTCAVLSKTIYMNEATVWSKRNLESELDLDTQALLEAMGGPKLEKGLVEPKIVGDFVKFNSNTGHVNGADAMQALSHFSYHHTNGTAVLCDLQGGRYDSCYVLTDPVIMSCTGTYGPTDLGLHGISNFMAHHKCNHFCQRHWKKHPAAQKFFDPREGSSIMLTAEGPGAAGPLLRSTKAMLPPGVFRQSSLPPLPPVPLFKF
jgi:hypothetical protein